MIFVAASIRASALAASHSLSSRSAQTLVLITTSIVVAWCWSPHSPTPAIRLEVLGWALLSGVVMLVLDRRAGHRSAQRAARYVERFSPNTVTSILLAIAGATFLAEHGGGLYWLLPTVAASLLGGTFNAWIFLVSDA